MAKEKPLVSIGMIVYNDASYLKEALDSLINQTFHNLEIIISDDCSTDDSPKICEEYSRKDDRIKYTRNEENIGEITNINKVANLAQGKYFMWASGHDKWDSSYIEKCVNKLEENPKASVCFTFRKYINESGNEQKIGKIKLDTSNNSQFMGFLKAIWFLCDHVMYGVVRRDALKKTRKYICVLSPDHVLRTELALQGKIIQITEPLFYFRQHRIESYEEVIKRRLSNWSKHKNLRWFYLGLPHWSTIHEYAKGARYNSDNLFKKIIYSATAYLVGGIRYAKVLLKDIIKLPVRIKYVKEYRK